MTEEKRIIRRQRVLKTGRIMLPNGVSTLSCIIRNINVAGAQIELPPTTAVPPKFALVDVQTGRSYNAEVVWQKGNRWGLSFSDDPQEEPED